MNIKSNIKQNKYTTGTGLAMLLILLLRLFKIDIGQVFDMPASDVLLYLGVGISAIISLISKDPNK